jgi:hypothetical protein
MEVKVKTEKKAKLTKPVLYARYFAAVVFVLLGLWLISAGCSSTVKTPTNSSYKILYLVKTTTDGPAAASVYYTNDLGDTEDIYYSAHKGTWSYEMTVEPGTLVEFKAKLETKGTITCMLVHDGILKDKQTTDLLWHTVTCSHIVGE